MNLENSDLYMRRMVKNQQNDEFDDICSYCKFEFNKGELHVSVDRQFFHVDCFNCAQCFSPLLNGNYFNYDNKFYCEYDFIQNYAPICQKCKKPVLGTVIKTIRGNYHPECLKCDDCGKKIDRNLYFEMMRNQCRDCHQKHEKYDRCAECKLIILPEERLYYNNDVWHIEHFNCFNCNNILTNNNYQIWNNKLYCIRCYDIYIMKTCAHCHRVIDFNVERGKEANGKYYHVNHFVCNKCGNLILESHQIYNGKIYCKLCYLRESRESCYLCSKPSNIIIFDRNLCTKCFKCVHCNKDLTKKSKIFSIDNQPICRKCDEKWEKEKKKLEKYAYKNFSKSPKTPK